MPRAALAVLTLLLASGSVAAHAGGEPVEARIDFPPWILWLAGSFVVALSFAVVGAFLTRGESAARAPPPREPAPGATLGRVLGLSVFVGSVAVGLALDHVAPVVLLYAALLHLVPLASYLVGNAWEPVSPFRLLLPLADRLRGGAARPWPARLGAWPAVALALLLFALEASAWSERGGVALALAAHAVATFAGLVVFGEAWLLRAEVFTVAARWWSALAPVLAPRGWTRPLPTPARGEAAFLVALLFGVNFDGFLATPAGAAAETAAVAALGSFAGTLALLLALYAAFALAWLGIVAGIRRWSQAREPLAAIAARFAPSLLPIAVAYHLAHAAPQLVEAVWPIPDAALPWLGLAQVLAILAGHVLAVAVAHRLAFGGFPSRVQAIRSEVPLTAGMVLYTMVGLWLLAAAGVAP